MSARELALERALREAEKRDQVECRAGDDILGTECAHCGDPDGKHTAHCPFAALAQPSPLAEAVEIAAGSLRLIAANTAGAAIGTKEDAIRIEANAALAALGAAGWEGE